MDKVLIAEDDVKLSVLIRAFLKPFSDRFETIFVKDGLEAIEVLKKREKVSLLVTDLKMPKVEGLILLAYMNKNFPKTPCIIMTSLRLPHVKEKLKKDVLFYLEKPFTKEALTDAILKSLKKDDMGGSLQGISIVSFVQLIEMDKKSCICEIESAGNPKGLFYFENGVLYDAAYGDLKGKEAALKIISIDYATINFKPLPSEKNERRIQSELTALILEALRQKDEAGALTESDEAHALLADLDEL